MSQNQLKSIIAIASKIINEEEAILSGSVKLWALWSKVAEDPWADENFRLFGIIDSDVDDLLLNTDKSLWNSEALSARDVEIAGRENFYKEDVLNSCKLIIERFS